MEKKKIVVSGIRLIGAGVHLGSYIGALERWKQMSKSGEYECYFFVADLHTLTILKPVNLYRATNAELQRFDISRTVQLNSGIL